VVYGRGNGRNGWEEGLMRGKGEFDDVKIKDTKSCSKKERGNSEK
jgi:hypothetical protein